MLCNDFCCGGVSLSLGVASDLLSRAGTFTVSLCLGAHIRERDSYDRRDRPAEMFCVLVGLLQTYPYLEERVVRSCLDQTVLGEVCGTFP